MGMMKLPIPKTPFEFIGMYITQLPTSKDGYKYILTILDHFSPYLIMVPMVSQTAEEVSKAFVENLVLKFGVLQKIISDQGTKFMSDLIQNICYYI
jgi:IS30 family transposase